ncbi:MAG: DNA translocase FtsK [Acidaminococcaceae bacterium]|nr:DNA translocase FtsK [Acidaminococcaceae bacterium]
MSSLDVLAEKPNHIFPPLNLLNPAEKNDHRRFVADVKKQCETLEKTLVDFRVNAKVTGVTCGPTVTRYELAPAPGVKVSSVVNLSEDIALRLAAPGVRVEAPIPGKAAIGIEVPNITNDMVSFREIVDCEAVRNNPSKLCVGLGKDIEGNVITIDLSKMPHLLVAGTTGSGKSVCVNTLLTGIMFKARPDEVKLILVDPKVVELTNYNGIPHLLVPVVTDAKKAASALHWAVAEMERRYKSFADTRVRDIKAYNAQAEEKMPFIVIVIDEMSDLMMVAKADVEDAILRLAQKARACGIHMVLATQRPSVDVITGIVKANIPSRIAFAVSSLTDSRTILDMGGAEKLLGKGDMLFYPIGSNKPLRVQGAFVSDEELNRITDFIKEQAIPVEYSDEVTNVALPSDSQKEEKNASGNGEETDNSGQDELLEEAIRLVLELGQASSSMLQRRFRIGYNRAARLVDTMEELGIVGPATGSKPRELLMSRDEVEYRFLHKEDFGDSQ